MTRKILSSLRPWGLPASAVSRRAYNSLSERLHRDLTLRQLPLTFDYLHPQPSYLLDLSLIDIFRESRSKVEGYSALPSVNDSLHMPMGHHLVYFPPPVPLSQLLSDGTDTLHAPGEPFNRRLWAGGHLVSSTTNNLPLDGRRAVCIETIRDVISRGQGDEERLLVRIERRIGSVAEGEEEATIRDRMGKTDTCGPNMPIIENRDLVFMREKTHQQLETDKSNFGRSDRIIKPPSGAVFRQSVTPSKALLFRFSALTFNAHSIHLDKAYTQNVEGYRNLLVHGPLTLSLLLTALRYHLAPSNQAISDIHYRNIAPLYVDETFFVAGKPKSSKDGAAWDVWIESSNGGLAVRGTAQVRNL